MKKSEYLSTLFVGIDVSARANVICALNFEQDRLLEFAVANSQPGADQIADTLSILLADGNFTRVVIALESTSFYGIHIANFLSSCAYWRPICPMFTVLIQR